MCSQQAVRPEPVAARLLHDNDRHRTTAAPLGAQAQAAQQGEQARTVAGRNAALARLVPARRAGRDDPAPQAQLQRHEQRGAHGGRRGTIKTGGGADRMFNVQH